MKTAAIFLSPSAVSGVAFKLGMGYVVVMPVFALYLADLDPALLTSVPDLVLNCFITTGLPGDHRTAVAGCSHQT